MSLFLSLLFSSVGFKSISIYLLGFFFFLFVRVLLDLVGMQTQNEKKSKFEHSDNNENDLKLNIYVLCYALHFVFRHLDIEYVSSNVFTNFH